MSIKWLLFNSDRCGCKIDNCASNMLNLAVDLTYVEQLEVISEIPVNYYTITYVNQLKYS